MSLVDAKRVWDVSPYPQAGKLIWQTGLAASQHSNSQILPPQVVRDVRQN